MCKGTSSQNTSKAVRCSTKTLPISTVKSFGKDFWSVKLGRKVELGTSYRLALGPSSGRVLGLTLSK